MSHLKVTSLSKSYGSNKILHSINLGVNAGEFVSLLGPSGCGKTTTLRCVAGLEKPDSESGPIEIGQTVLSSGKNFVPPEKRNFGMVFQSYAVWPHMNVFDNVSFPLLMHKPKPSRQEIDSKVSSVLKLVHLDGLEKRFGHELSGGQQQRVALARALVTSPQLLLLDEPLSNLDVLLREELRAEIQRLQTKLKLTTILVTHDQREALSLSHRIILMNKGKIEAEGNPEELYARPPTEFTAEFLAGGQTVRNRENSQTIQFLPRNWKLSGTGSALSVKIQSRLCLGNEYEYWAENSHYDHPIKFFSDKKFEIGSTTQLFYQT